MAELEGFFCIVSVTTIVYIEPYFRPGPSPWPIQCQNVTRPRAQDVSIADHSGPEMSVPSFVSGFSKRLPGVVADDDASFGRHDQDRVVARDADLDDRAAELQDPGHVHLISRLAKETIDMSIISKPLKYVSVYLHIFLCI